LHAVTSPPAYAKTTPLFGDSLGGQCLRVVQMDPHLQSLGEGRDAVVRRARTEIRERVQFFSFYHKELSSHGILMFKGGRIISPAIVEVLRVVG